MVMVGDVSVVQSNTATTPATFTVSLSAASGEPVTVSYTPADSTAAVNHLVNEAGITFLWRNMAATKAGIGEVLAAYVDVDREAEAEALRDLVEGAGLGAEAANALLLEVEEKLESLTRDRLAGARVDPSRALEDVRARVPGQAAHAGRSA